MAYLRQILLILPCLFFPVLVLAEMGIAAKPLLTSQKASLITSSSECQKLFSGCQLNQNEKNRKQSFEIEGKSCELQQKKYNCQKLITDEPNSQRRLQIKSKIQSCSASSMCEQHTPAALRNLKSCFWNEPGDFGIDVWEMILKGAGYVNQCTAPQGAWKKAVSIWKCQAPIYWLFKAAQDFPNRAEALAQAEKIYTAGEDWVRKKGIQIDCYTPEARFEMACYGAIALFAPDKILKVAKAIPQSVKLARLEQLGAKARLTVTAERAQGADRAYRATKGRQSVRAEQMIQAKSPTGSGLQITRKISQPVNVVGKSAIPKKLSLPTSVAVSKEFSPRDRFSDQYVSRNMTTAAENEKWVELANDLNPPSGTRFFDVENSMMKHLNDTTLDKNFVTALTNQHKELIATKMQELVKKYPDVEFIPYSDFKSVRYALKPKPPATSLPYGIDAEIGKAFELSNQEFITILKNKKLVPKGEDPSWWFRAGWGDTADQATFATRYSRTAPSTNQMRRFTDADLRESQNTTLKYTEAYRQNVQSSLGKTSLLEESSVPGKMIPRAEVFDALRKTQTPEELISFLKKTTGQQLTPSQAKVLRTYGNMTDEFSPGIHIIQREQAILDKNTGGITFDLVGAGSENAQATAKALAKATDVESAVRESRVGEKSVTENLARRKNEVKNAVAPILEKYKINARFISSGDDMALIPEKALSDVIKKEIAQALAKTENPSSIRMSSVGQGIPTTTDRMVMATQGESVEKATRKYLQGQLPREILDKTVVSVQMEGKSVGSGNVRLVLGEGQSLTAVQRAAFQEAFKKAVQSLKANYVPVN
jgi:hypothetical protein